MPSPYLHPMRPDSLTPRSAPLAACSPAPARETTPPEPMPVPMADTVPEPAPVPEPIPEPAPEPAPVPEPIPEPAPEPFPVPEPEPIPAPTLSFILDPEPDLLAAFPAEEDEPDDGPDAMPSDAMPEPAAVPLFATVDAPSAPSRRPFPWLTLVGVLAVAALAAITLLLL